MYANDGRLRRLPVISRTPGPLLIGLLMLTVSACQEAPTAPDGLSSAAATGPTAESPAAASGSSSAMFPNWHQGFNHDTDGWYGGETAGTLGWCGSIEQQDRRSGDVTPSAGSGYATVEQGPCNAFWAGLFGADLVNAPWAPGDDFSNFSDSWPVAGYVTELDIYLDPEW